MRKWLFLIAWFPFNALIAQAYHYLGIEEGLSNRSVYSIQKDSIGYMWFLTHEGIDRFNGKEFKHYKLMDGNVEVSPLLNLRWLYIDRNETMWEIGEKGRIFRYDPSYDKFVQVYRPDGGSASNVFPLSYSFAWVDHNNHIWLCSQHEIILYHTDSKKVTHVKKKTDEEINDIEQIDDTHYIIGTDKGIHYAELKGEKLTPIPNKELDKIKAQVNDFYLERRTGKLFIGTFQEGIIVYDTIARSVTYPKHQLDDISITCIKPLDGKQLLIATDGIGIQRMNTETYHIEPYLVNHYNSYNGMNSNSVNDLYIDKEQRIWMANYQLGITMLNNRYPTYQWIRHSMGNPQSLVNDRVNAIIEDSDGDLWFGTNNGISLQESRSGQWHTFLNISSDKETTQSHRFITLCEVSPGIIWAGGYSSDIYLIEKKSRRITVFNPSTHSEQDIRPDKYIYDIYKDSEGYVWAGGYYNLKRINPQTKEVRLYKGLHSLTTILEYNDWQMWIGSEDGLYLLDKSTGSLHEVPLPTETISINALYQTRDGKHLYIATAGSGLLIYTPEKGTFIHYHKDNSTLISNNIYSILSDGDNKFILSTENNLTCFYPQEQKFYNWTKDMGLMTLHYNTNAGVLRRNGTYALGSSDGVVEFDKDMTLPRNYHSKMLFSDLQVAYKEIYPGTEGSPLKEDINQTEMLKLRGSQNTLSLMVSSINYDYPSNILYSWRLEGFYDQWTTPSYENRIRYTNIPAGKYQLQVRAISNEDNRIVFDQRTLHITIACPFWLTLWAMLIYVAGLTLITYGILRYLYLRKQRNVSDEKIQFFVNTAHDIRTPLTLIKAPLEEMRGKEQVRDEGMGNLNTALRNVHALLRLTTNLINFERTDVYSSELYLSEQELNTFVREVCDAFKQYAEIKNITFDYQSNFDYLSVWFDKEKMESILQNLISNALKYTPASGTVEVVASASDDFWSIEVKDSGIGIPTNEQKQLFRLHFRGSNAINSKVTGSGTGLMLVWKLVKLHKGKISLNSTLNQGTTVRISFPKDSKRLRRNHVLSAPGKQLMPIEFDHSFGTAMDIYNNLHTPHSGTRKKILVVEDNDELRAYLSHTLSEEYTVQNCSNGKDALIIIPQYKPDMVISDIMMPEMRGDELCRTLKNDIDTSHIPVILLTALNDEKDILSGLNVGADEYIVKPFNIGILKATIANLLANRALLRSKYANLEIDEEEKDDEAHTTNCMHDMDWKFIASVKKHVETHIDDPDMTVDTICALMHMSRTSFYNKIKALTDQAPADYIRLIRLKRASELLKEGTHSVTEVAEMCGFSDAKYFREVFKKHYNVSPTQYAKGETQQKGEENEE